MDHAVSGLPSIAKSGWLDTGFIAQGPWGLTWLRPEQLLGLQGFDGLTHSLFWSMLVNAVAYVGVSLWRAPSGREASQAEALLGRVTSAQPRLERRGAGGGYTVIHRLRGTA